MNRYIVVLGRASSLCEAELTAVLNRLSVKFSLISVKYPILVFDCKEELDVYSLINILGGTVKISYYLKSFKSYSYQLLIDFLADNLKLESNEFGISNYTTSSIPIEQILNSIKNKLKTKRLKARYILPKDSQILSSVVVKKQKMIEYLLTDDKTNDGWILGKTLVVQDSDEWNNRDFGRPFADPHSGMLPPKVSRIMVNIAMSYGKTRIVNESKTILDPFCGMGTILQEALLLGFNVNGSDYNESVLTKTQKNLDWLRKKYPVLSNFSSNLTVSDATHASHKNVKESIDAIITEPFLGSPFEVKNKDLWQKDKKVTIKQMKNVIKGLEKLYLGCFKDWYKLLKNDGVVVIALPEIEFNQRYYSVKKLIDNCENLGYTKRQGPFPYFRPQAIVRRQIYVLQKYSSNF